MRVNIRVENYGAFKYVGCATAAEMLYEGLSQIPDIEVEINSKDHDHDITHCHTIGPGAFMSQTRATGKTLLTVHSVPSLNSGNLALSSLINKVYKPMYGRYDGLITLTNFSEAEIRKMLPDSKLYRMTNCVNRDRFKPDAEKRAQFRAQYNIPDDRKVILQVAQQTPRKGIYDFIDIARKLPDYTFVWVGGFAYGVFSSEKKEVERRIASASPNVIFTGFVDDISAVYAAADVFLFPSFKEIMPMSILEALSSGLPVVSREWYEYPSLYPGIAAYFKNIDEAIPLLNDDELLRKAAAHARDSVEPNDIHVVAANHRKLYESVLGM